MILYVNANNEVKDVNETKDTSLKALEVTADNPFEGWSVAKICCYRVAVSDGIVTMMTPYVDSRLIEHIEQLGNGVETNSEGVSENGTGIFDLAEVTDENSTALFALAEYVALVDERLTALEEK